VQGGGSCRAQARPVALEEFLKHREEKKIIESINRCLAEDGNELSAEDEAWLEHGRQVVWRELEHDDWGPDGTGPKGK
jgi:hypothetical protein